jgi:hypothetical protein
LSDVRSDMAASVAPVVVVVESESHKRPRSPDSDDALGRVDDGKKQTHIAGAACQPDTASDKGCVLSPASSVDAIRVVVE